MATDRNTATPRRKNRRAEIEALFALRAREGLTWGQLSARSGIPLGTLTSWQQRLHKDAKPNPGLVEVAVVRPAQPAACDFTLETSAGLRIVVPSGFDADALSRLLSVVGASC